MVAVANNIRNHYDHLNIGMKIISSKKIFYIIGRYRLVSLYSEKYL